MQAIAHLHSQVKVMHQLLSAVAGASGGAAASQRTIAPQFVPISQLVLMTVKVVQELKAEQ